MSTSATPHRPKIVVLDGYTLNPGDLSWNKLKALGDAEIYDYSSPDEVLMRAREAEIILVNKTIINADIITQLPQLRCICVTATGYNNVDITFAKSKNIPVCNVSGYGTDAVAQHVFALLLELTNHVGQHYDTVLNGEWTRCRDFSYWKTPIVELAGKTMGIYGFGKIGQKVATIAQAFDMQVLATHKHPERDARPGVTFVPLNELFTKCDVITLHAPMTDENKGIVNKKLLSLMKSSAFIINTARGGLINEADLKEALENDQIAGAGLDVISEEPPKNGNILFGVKNCIITPHNAWGSVEARERLMEETIRNIAAFEHGKPRNVVNE
ncbi:MAG: D-2-hydroxyacid dehydrogenase [Saprospiraceae bacterium]